MDVDGAVVEFAVMRGIVGRFGAHDGKLGADEDGKRK
jgi:hypothetical protein